jgi:hypothetical protein
VPGTWVVSWRKISIALKSPKKGEPKMVAAFAVVRSDLAQQLR